MGFNSGLKGLSGSSSFIQNTFKGKGKGHPKTGHEDPEGE